MEAFRSEEDQDEKSESRRFAARDVLTRLKSSSRIEISGKNYRLFSHDAARPSRSREEI